MALSTTGRPRSGSAKYAFIRCCVCFERKFPCITDAPGGAGQGRMSTPSTLPLGRVLETATCVQDPGAKP